jgi:nitroimidazol reductase NimA-like FMN-containing flavoprotein (pyridoxamine 5'-phosphate oxidase superfamily)
MTMRRHDKEIVSREEIDAVIREADVCRLGLAMDNTPYIVPISFGYDGEAIFIHTASKGKKIDIFAANPRVCFEFEAHVQIQTDDGDACKWTFDFESVVGYGVIGELVSETDKAGGLNHIMRHYSGREWPFAPKDLATTRVWRIDIESITGKRSAKKTEIR